MKEEWYFLKIYFLFIKEKLNYESIIVGWNIYKKIKNKNIVTNYC